MSNTLLQTWVHIHEIYIPIYYLVGFPPILLPVTEPGYLGFKILWGLLYRLSISILHVGHLLWAVEF
jgi:hypothetical protein